MTDRFRATRISFEDMPGYWMEQIRNGQTVMEQFIAEEDFETFCKAVGIKPEIID